MGMNTLSQQFEHLLRVRKTQGLYRTRQLPANAVHDLDFSSNDYLSLSTDEHVKEGFRQGFERYPAGSGGSMVLSGYHAAHHQLERAFADALKVDDCLLFSSGYAANLAVISLLGQFEFGTQLLIDKAVHASIYDGLKLSDANFSRFLHNNVSDLNLKLQKSQDSKIVLTESVFSMSGLYAPLADISALVQAGAHALIVDEAHGFGVLGAQGLGGTVAAGLTQEEVPLRIIPFGKALGASGAIVAGNALWIDALLQFARQAMYSTAISPAYAYGVRETLSILQKADDRRASLQQLINYFRLRTQKSVLRWRDSRSPIQQLQLGCPFLAADYMKKLYAAGIQCFCIRQPTVPKVDSGLRIILNAHHRQEDIDRLFEVLES
ncbi:MAG: 8-amino-7-oxononanoate synthase [Gammaproteobacteria bacterium]|nr:8-amino-7-oxononanoate synthase [Gammaproteobacteria bacterium]